jgi:hypothetical protein
MFIRTVPSAFFEHKKRLKIESVEPEKIGAKILITTNGTQETMDLISNPDFQAFCVDNNIKTFSFSSDEDAGFCYNFNKLSREKVMSEMKSLKDNEDAILIHCDILAEGIDLPSITGVMPYRKLGVTKLTQTTGRGMRLLLADRIKLYSGEIKAGEYGKFIKPYCYFIIPEYFFTDSEYRWTYDTLKDIINTYEIPIEDVSTNESFLALIESVLPNITDPDEALKRDKVSALNHLFEDILEERQEVLFNKHVDSAADKVQALLDLMAQTSI